jgi:hypothetical protein
MSIKLKLNNRLCLLDLGLVLKKKKKKLEYMYCIFQLSKSMFGIVFKRLKSAFNTQKICLKKKVLV